jgi:hypothetical protein
MSFSKSSTTFTRFRITDPVPGELWPAIGHKLRQHSFRDIDNLPEERAWGWVNFDDLLDSEWRVSPPEKGGYLAFSLRLDTRRVAPAVLRKHLAVALREEEGRMRETGRKYVARERKKEIREQVLLRLMQRSLPVPAEFATVWNIAEGSVYFASTQSKVLDLFQTHFTLTFDLHLEPVTPYALAASMLGENGPNRLDNLEASSFA